MKILMVCLGNICRSPLAEGILKRKIEERKLNWSVDSAGTGNWHVGKLPDSRSIEIAQHHGIDITTQRSRQFVAKDLENYDLIFAMDSSNYQNIIKLASEESQKEKVELIMNLVEPKMNICVPDPYWDDNGFKRVFNMLEKACEKIIEKYT